MKDIIQISTGSSNVLLVSLPEGVNKVTMGGECPSCLKANIWHCAHADTCGNNFDAVKCHKDEIFLESIILSLGNWIEVGWSDELNDEQLKEILSYVKFGNGNRFMDYRIGISAFLFETPLESWQSFLSANNIKERKLVLRDNK